MISKMFLLAVKLCLSASIVTGVVLLLRPVLRKAPRSLVCALWILVGLRLVIPVLPQSKVSLIPEEVSGGAIVEALQSQIVEETMEIGEDWDGDFYKEIREKNKELPIYQKDGRNYIVVSKQSFTAPKTFGESVVPGLSVVWVIGIGIMLLYMFGSFLNLHRRLRTAVIREKGVWESDEITSPFILGVIRPRIYLPTSLTEEERVFVLAHEKTHLKRGDQIWKLLGYLLLAVYWFNPLFWLAYFLLCRDIEGACDERVIKNEDPAYRKAYSETLLKLNVRQKAVTACPLAFSEAGVGGRIRSVLNYKKPAFWLIVTALAVSIVAAGCALTDPVKKESGDPGKESAESAESTENSTEAAEGTPAETVKAEHMSGLAQAAFQKLEASFPFDQNGAPIYPDDYAGNYPDGKDLVICLKDPDEAMIKRYLEIIEGCEDGVHIKAVRYSYNELQKMLRETADELLADKVQVNLYWVDVENNGIAFGVSEPYVEKVRAVLQQKYPDIHCSVEPAGPIILN